MVALFHIESAICAAQSVRAVVSIISLNGDIAILHEPGGILLENHFPWSLVHKIGVRTPTVSEEVTRLLSGQEHRPAV